MKMTLAEICVSVIKIFSSASMMLSQNKLEHLFRKVYIIGLISEGKSLVLGHLSLLHSEANVIKLFMTVMYIFL